METTPKRPPPENTLMPTATAETAITAATANKAVFDLTLVFTTACIGIDFLNFRGFLKILSIVSHDFRE
ncbi:MAG: hypothetical protein A2663_03230 [Candidatus Buchananbacteria bacterium RIFCSPHIGHO2_01_FULL_46_12]|uniref:Uncharacterized protein n=1 Tax=Candidatus Buchananbacteria bacterium RIFCSPHIGHO2_01_FULL_46_12 TaxID=1797536 RepID=A0A1G1Y6Q0_9BACT|nr:MAG: hypothetical protein A2663_03230 [Candidatus Buchananbacteria bacterium RIFCSPHIGHO2_01_FULL_46_12]